MADSIQNELESFVRLREKKRLDEIEHKRIVEILLNKKREEEEKAILAKKQAEEDACLKAVNLILSWIKPKTDYKMFII